MTSFTFTADELKTAPPEVRQWLLARAEADLLHVTTPAAPLPHAPQLAACTPDEARRMFELLAGDFTALNVFVELARETSWDQGTSSLHAISIANLMRHTRLDDRVLLSCLGTINRAFQQVRADPEATFFGLDQASHVYIHETTHRSIRLLWEELVHAHETRPSEGKPTFPPALVSFTPREMGPSEDVGAHRPSR